ncbi:MAG: hypothetical protein M0C28_19180 [Candidatus Moduliflexus flocculans]|nr:hypothetical protein [Candidatus Moduliflexus flocculans]
MENRNKLDQLSYSLEKLVKENKDKIPDVHGQRSRSRLSSMPRKWWKRARTSRSSMRSKVSTS